MYYAGYLLGTPASVGNKDGTQTFVCFPDCWCRIQTCLYCNAPSNWITFLAFALSTPARSGGGYMLPLDVSLPFAYTSEALCFCDPTIFTLHLGESLLHGFVVFLVQCFIGWTDIHILFLTVVKFCLY